MAQLRDIVRERGGTRGSDVLFNIPLGEINIKEEWNQREEYGDIDEIKAFIRSNGVMKLPPLLLYNENGTFFIMDGHRRHRAIRELIDEERLEIKAIPCQFLPKSSSIEEQLALQITRNSGKPFTILETTKVVVKLINFGWTPEDVALKIGKSVTHINQLLKLHSAPAALKNLVKEDKLSPTTGLDILSKNPDIEGAIAEAKNAIALAESNGKTKATSADVAEARGKNGGILTPKAGLKQVMLECESHHGLEFVEVKIPLELYERLKETIRPKKRGQKPKVAA